MPGVLVTTATTPGPSAAQTAPGSTYFLAGQTERGDPTKPLLIRSMAEYGAKCGARVAYGFAFDDLSVFFGEGGTQAWLVRVVGPAATVGLLVLKDSSAVNTIQLNAASAGAWSGNITATVVASTLPNQFKILVFYNAIQVEAWGPFPDPVTACSVINAGSGYVKAVNMASVTAAPGNNPVPVGPSALSSGSDDRASITGPMYLAALNLCGPSLGSGLAAIPGQDSSVVGTGLIAHARANGRIANLSPVQGASQAAAISAAALFRGTLGSEGAGFSWPWVQIPDGAGGLRTIPPDGFVAGVRSRTQVAAGPWQAPAGQWGLANYISGLETLVTDANGDIMNDEAVNCIRPLGGIRLYGWRSLSTDTLNYRLLTGRDTLNYVATLGKVALQQYVFATVDAFGHLFAKITASMRAILEPIRQAGGLYELIAADGITLVDPGYLIDDSAAVNTPALLATNEVDCNVFLRVAPTGELVRLTVTKVALGSPL